MPYVGVGAKRAAEAKDPLGRPMLKVYGFILISLILIVAIALLGKHHADKPSGFGKPLTLGDVQSRHSKHLISAINSEKIKQNLREITKHPHVAGTEANKVVSETIQRLWNEAGLEDVHTNSYEVLLSYPDYENPNRVQLKDKSGSIIFRTSGISPVIIKEEQGDPNAGIQWLAYAANGTVTADVVYVNRGTPLDFINLEKMGVSVKGKIALMRYGECFRGNKVFNAELNGAVGVILFTDPSDVAPQGTNSEIVYPNTVYMPNEGVQRGSIMYGDGDALTPLYPSKPTIFKTKTIEEAKKEGNLPSIPALPVSYTTAYKILSRMSGRRVPSDWQGLLNVTYKLGPGFTNDEKLTIEVHSKLEIRTIRNVIGYIRGRDEPDRYVMVGNHFDAWVYGSIDPNSGTAIMAEMARAMVQTMNETGWKPARTIVFNNWDAEEFGLIGSTEFVEEFVEILQQRAVVYINMDCLKFNESIAVKATPELYQIVVNAAKSVPNFSEDARKRGELTLYDTFIKNFPRPDQLFPGIPSMKVPDGGSDMAPFLTYAGIPVIDFTTVNKSLSNSNGDYPLYHSLYETAFTNEHLIDVDDFAVHRGVGQFWAELARRFADEVILPFNHTMLAEALIRIYIKDVEKAIINDIVINRNDYAPIKEQLKYLKLKAYEFFNITQAFDMSKMYANFAFSQNPYDSRAISGVNERQMGISRCFVNPRGIPNAPESRHVLYSISAENSYAGSVITGVYDAIDKYKRAKSPEEKTKAANSIAEQLSVVQYSINCAVKTLKDVI